MSCLEKDRELRPSSALALRDALGRIDCETGWSDSAAKAWWLGQATRVRSQRNRSNAEEARPTGTTVAVDLGRRLTVLEAPRPGL